MPETETEKMPQTREIAEPGITLCTAQSPALLPVSPLTPSSVLSVSLGSEDCSGNLYGKKSLIHIKNSKM